MGAPDIVRAIVISLAAFLIGTVVFGASIAWRDRHLPVPRRAPYPAVLAFVAGYVLLLVQAVIGRWENLGEEIGPSVILVLLSLLLNVVAVLMLVRSAKVHTQDH